MSLGFDGEDIRQATDSVVQFGSYTPPANEWRLQSVITSYNYVKHWWRFTGWHTIVEEKVEVRELCSFHHTPYYMLRDGRIARLSFLVLEDEEGRTMCTKPKFQMSYFIGGFLVVKDENVPLEVRESANLLRLER